MEFCECFEKMRPGFFKRTLKKSGTQPLLFSVAIQSDTRTLFVRYPNKQNLLVFLRNYEQKFYFGDPIFKMIIIQSIIQIVFAIF